MGGVVYKVTLVYTSALLFWERQFDKLVLDNYHYLVWNRNAYERALTEKEFTTAASRPPARAPSRADAAAAITSHHRRPH